MPSQQASKPTSALTPFQHSKPSHHQLSSFIQQNDSHQSQNCYITSSNNNNQIARIDKTINDGEIKFDNGWLYSGQHCDNHFHGWGRLIDCQYNQVYKGNFANGYFHGYGTINYNPIFQYLINFIALQSWLDEKIISKQQYSLNLNLNKDTLNQIQQDNLSSDCYQISKVKWLNYTGEFSEGNITGYGTIQISIITSNQNNSSYSTQTLSIVGKFLEGQIINGIIKK